MTTRILHVVTNVGHYDDPTHPTGLWLSELAHAWEVFEGRQFEQTIVSPQGGKSPLEPRSLTFPNYDKVAKAWHQDPDRMALLEKTLSPDQVEVADFDAIYLTGGHAVMYDFPDSNGLQRIIRDLWEQDKIVSSVCHGYCGLLNVRLTDGSLLVTGKHLTGFAWREEVLAGVDKLVPYNAEEEMKKRGALYQKAKIPFAPYAISDGKLVTGQNPGSAKQTALKVAELL